MVRKSTMGCYVNIIFTMMLVIKSKQYNRENCCRSSHFQLLAENSRADAPSISSEFTQVISMCAQLCLAQILCTSFNYHNVAKICQLLAYNHFDDKAEILIQSPGWSFYQKELIQDENNCLGCNEFQTVDEAKDGLGCRCRNLDNIALRKPTSQSSTCYSAPSTRAVDGDTTANFYSGTCSTTCNNDASIWWMVDFGQTATVSAINITNRSDCCGIRLSNFDIRIGDVSGGNGDANALCLSNVGVPEADTTSFKCSSKLNGRYLYIKSNLKQHLTLCEVKVFGEFV